MKVILKVILAGFAGTLGTDVWTFILKIFGVHSHGLLLVGQWVISHMGTSLQNRLIGNELLIGWTAHYCLGISFSFLPLLLYGKKWLNRPTITKALIIGVITFVLGIFIIQPILNFGVAFSNYANQPVILLKVALFHIVYSIGLYTASRMMANPKLVNN
ncbi:DUF2938 domain-containing protein [Elizabethkingia meningoseptica]|uniref:DUF2938 family protein n=1 Tax=Elizabethkingia meningoseptica TaxID=238 RepID=UPI0023AEC7CC|nr:DUF2938 family protein [Elizabethkingia meningoseptica]MDE5469924.1 DUF2938 domain-containing protein [Elizabethkingia meningoseptica]